MCTDKLRRVRFLNHIESFLQRLKIMSDVGLEFLNLIKPQIGPSLFSEVAW